MIDIYIRQNNHFMLSLYLKYLNISLAQCSSFSCAILKKSFGRYCSILSMVQSADVIVMVSKNQRILNRNVRPLQVFYILSIEDSTTLLQSH